MANASTVMTIGTLAKRADGNIDTVRYYERRGLLPKARRTHSGYRTFDEATVERLRFIKEAQAIGFTLTEIKQLIALRVTPSATCADVRERAETKLYDIDQKIVVLRRMKRTLQRLVSACQSDGPASECSFLANLNQRRSR